MKKERAKRNRTKKDIKVLLRIAVIFVIIVIIAFPFVLDILYGRELLRPIFKNSFPADTWFSFIGSYFPAAIIGCLTLYQAYIIQYQEKRYRRLLSQHQFVPSSPAHIYRYDDNRNRMGDWEGYQVKQMLAKCGKDDLYIDWNKGYILECGVFAMQDVGIDAVEIKKVDWEINGRHFCQNDASQMTSAIERVSRDEYKLKLFWKFADEEATLIEITKCMVYGFRQSSHYDSSRVTLVLQLIDDFDDCYEVSIQFEMEAGKKDVYSLCSVKGKIVAVRRKE